MRMMVPVTGMRKPAPAAISMWLTVSSNPSGLPSSFGLSENEYCVLAMQTGSRSKPRCSISFRFLAASGERVQVSATVIVTVDREGAIYLAGRPVQAALLAGSLAELREQNPEIRILVQADRAVAYERVIAVLDASRRAGITDVGLSTRPPARGDIRPRR